MPLIKSIKKNLPEAIALFSGSMPRYIYGSRNFRDIPVFCFHSAGFPQFEKQLQFLKKNRFITLDGDELLERLHDRNYRNNGKDIVLTFDDGLASVWTVAFPLLLKYKLKIISFILPGLVPEGASASKTIDQYANTQDLNEIVNRDHGPNPLCNWKEIEAMHASGHIDIQSHGMLHMLISTAPRLIDFIHPGFDASNYGNTHIPAYTDSQNNTSREFVLGHPVFENTPRLSGRHRYIDDFELRQECAEHVVNSGGESFFKAANWRKQLTGIVDSHLSAHANNTKYESEDTMYAAMTEELAGSRRIIEARLRNKQVKHFCFPWFAACEISIELARSAGYEAVHLGATTGFKSARSPAHPLYIKRLQEEYLMHLPGEGNTGLVEVFRTKLKKGR